MRLVPSRLGLLVAAALLAGGSAQASVVYTDSGTVGSDSVSASATFTISGNTLTIVLQNTSPANSLETPTNTLTGLTFKLNGGDPSLTPVSAVSPNAIFDSAACSTSCTGTNVNVDGEWGYQNNYGSGGTLEAVASSGYLTTGLSHDIGNFNNGAAGTNLAGPNSLDGVQFGIISANAGNLSTGNGGLSGNALIQDKVVLTLTGVSGLTESEIGSVSFLYGTSPDATLTGSLCTTCTPGSVPEPGTVALFGVALLLWGWVAKGRHGRPAAGAALPAASA